MAFSASWQTLPNTGSSTLQFRCAGTVTTTATGGTRCSSSGGFPVEVRINGSTYRLYGGCTQNTTDYNCMTSITPSGASYLEAVPTSPGRLLCRAMGWPIDSTLTDRIATSSSAPAYSVAVLQTNPTVIGTASLANYSTYVDCEP